MNKEKVTNLLWNFSLVAVGSFTVYIVGSSLTRAVYTVQDKAAKSILDKILYVSNNLGKVAWWPPTFNGKPLLGGLILLAVVAMVVLYALTNKKSYRPGEEHGSAKWGTHKDILPFEDTKNPDNNLIMTATEKLYLNDLDHKRPMKLQRNQFVTVIGELVLGKPEPLSFRTYCSVPALMLLLIPKDRRLDGWVTFLRSLAIRLRSLIW